MSRPPAPDVSWPASPRGGLMAWPQPRHTPAPALHATQVPRFPGAARLRVLVVDDDPVNLLLMTAHMAPWGLAPWLAADGAEALIYACAVPFDLVLMDLQMPVLDGLGATLALRRFEALHGRAAVPVVAHSSARVAAAVLAAHGLNGRLDKPSSAEGLKACLLQWCPGLDEASVLDVPALSSFPGLAHRSAAGRHNASPR